MDLKNSMAFAAVFLAGIVFLAGCVTDSQIVVEPPIVVGDPVFPIVQIEELIEGELSPGSEVIVTAVIELMASDDRPDHLFYTFNWDDFEPTAISCDDFAKPKCVDATDVFQIEYNEREVTRTANQVTISVPVKILKEGEGIVQFEYTFVGEGQSPSLFAPAVFIKTV